MRRTLNDQQGHHYAKTPFFLKKKERETETV